MALVPGRRRVLAISAVAIVAIVASSSCSSGAGPAGASDRVMVVTTVSPITNIAQNVGGSCVRITGVVPEGTNSHTFEPQPSDAAAFAEADIVFMNGLHLEEPTRELAESTVPDGTPIVELGAATIAPEDLIYDFAFPESGGEPNPHLWTDPLLAKRYAEIVSEELSRIDPECAPEFRANYRAFAGRIDEFDALVREASQTVPEQNRKLLTYHDSFPYFAREYGWEVIGAIQPSEFADPTPQEVAGLIDQIRAQNLPAIFGSEVFPSPVLQQIAAETGTRYVDDLRDDDLPGENGDPDHSYLGLMRFDLTTIVEALGGDASALRAFDASNLQSGDDADYRS